MSYQFAQFNRKQQAIRAMSDIAVGTSESEEVTDGGKFKAVRYAKDLLNQPVETQAVVAPVLEKPEPVVSSVQEETVFAKADNSSHQTHAASSGQAAYQTTQPLPDEVKRDERDIAAVMWLASLLFLMIPGMLVLLNANASHYLKQQARESLNWTVTFLLGSILCTILVVVFIGGPLQVLLSIAHLVFCLMGANAARQSKAFRVPMSWRPLD